MMKLNNPDSRKDISRGDAIAMLFTATFSLLPALNVFSRNVIELNHKNLNQEISESKNQQAMKTIGILGGNGATSNDGS